MSGDYVCVCVVCAQADTDADGTTQTMTAVMRNSTRIHNIGITTNVRRLRVCVCAYTGIDGTHTTTTGMRNICTEAPQPAF